MDPGQASEENLQAQKTAAARLLVKLDGLALVHEPKVSQPDVELIRVKRHTSIPGSAGYPAPVGITPIYCSLPKKEKSQKVDESVGF